MLSDITIQQIKKSRLEFNRDFFCSCVSWKQLTQHRKINMYLKIDLSLPEAGGHSTTLQSR
jgi:hypothetical protein